MVEDMGVSGEVSDVRVRAAEEGELDIFVELAYETANVERALGYSGIVGDPRTMVLELTKRIYLSWEDPSYLMLVAVDEEDKVIGGLVGRLWDKGAMCEPRIVGKVELLCVREEVQRTYVGRTLGRMFEGLAIREGITRFETSCSYNNVGVQEGLIKEGFRRELVVMVRDGVGVDMEPNTPEQIEEE